MSEYVGTVKVRVIPDADGFQSKLRGQLPFKGLEKQFDGIEKAARRAAGAMDGVDSVLERSTKRSRAGAVASQAATARAAARAVEAEQESSQQRQSRMQRQFEQRENVWRMRETVRAARARAEARVKAERDAAARIRAANRTGLPGPASQTVDNGTVDWFGTGTRRRVAASATQAGREAGDRFNKAMGDRLNNSAAPYIIRQAGTSWLSGTLQSSGFTKSAHAVTALGSAMRGTGIAAAVAGGGIAAFGFGAYKALQKAGELEQVQVSMQTLFGSAAKANEMLDESIKFAQETPFDLASVTNGIKQLKAYGFAGKDLIPVMTDIGDATAALGLGAPGIQRLVMAFGQIQARGTFRADEARQLTEAGIPAWRALSDALTKTEGKYVSMQEVMRRAEAGEISSTYALRALRNEMQKSFGGGMQKQAETFAGTMEKLKEAMTLNMQRALLPGMKSLAQEAQKMIPTLSKFSSEIGEGLNEGIKGFVREGGPQLKQAIADLGPVLGDLLAKMGPKFGRIVGDLAEAFADIAPALADSIDVLYTFAEAATDVLKLIAKLPEPVQEFLIVGGAITATFGPAISTLGQMAFQLKLLSTLSKGMGGGGGGITALGGKFTSFGNIASKAGILARGALRFAGPVAIAAAIMEATAAAQDYRKEMIDAYSVTDKAKSKLASANAGTLPINSMDNADLTAATILTRGLGAAKTDLANAESSYSQVLQRSNTLITQRNNGEMRGQALTMGAKIALSNQATAARELATAQKGAGMSAQGLLRTVSGQHQAFMRNAVAMGFSKAEAAGLARQYNVIPKEVLTHIKQAGAEAVDKKVTDINGKIKDLKAQRTAIKIDGSQTKKTEKEVDGLNRKIKGLRKERAEVRAEAKNIKETIAKLKSVPKALKGENVDFKVIAKTADADAKIKDTENALKNLESTPYTPKVQVEDDSAAVATNISENLSLIPDEEVIVWEVRKQKNYHGGPAVAAFATGGTVGGPSGRDRVPAMLTAGEFVIRKSSVDRLGMGFLHYLNAHGRLPGFFTGGAVGGGIAAARTTDNAVRVFAKATTSFAATVKKDKEAKGKDKGRGARRDNDSGGGKIDWTPYKGSKKGIDGFQMFKAGVKGTTAGISQSSKFLEKWTDDIDQVGGKGKDFTQGQLDSFNSQLEERGYKLEDASWEREKARYFNDREKSRVNNQIADRQEFMQNIRGKSKYQDKDGKFVLSKVKGKDRKKYDRFERQIPTLQNRRQALNSQRRLLDDQDWNARQKEREQGVDQRFVQRRQAALDKSNANLRKKFEWEDTKEGVTDKESGDRVKKELLRQFQLGEIDWATLLVRTGEVDTAIAKALAKEKTKKTEDAFSGIMSSIASHSLRDLSYDGVNDWLKGMRDQINDSDLDAGQKNSLNQALNAQEATIRAHAARLERIAKGGELKKSMIDAVGGSIDWGRTTNPGSLSRSLTKQTTLMNQYASGMTQLRQSGLSQEALRRIAAMDPTQAAKFTRRLLAGGSTSINQFNQAVAGFEQAAENVGDRGAAAAWAETGEQAAQGFAAGMESQEPAIRAAMENIATNMLAAWKAALGIASPSKVFAHAAKAIPQGVVRGIESDQWRVERAVSLMVPPALPPVSYNSAGTVTPGIGGGITQNIYPTPGMSETQVATASARELSWALGV